MFHVKHMVDNLDTFDVTYRKPARRWLSRLDYLAVLRPTLMLPVWTMVLLGYYHSLIYSSSPTTFFLFHLPQLPDISIVVHPRGTIFKTLFLYSLLMGAVYIINQITDAETDDINDKLYLVAQGHVNITFLKCESVVLLLSTMLLTFYWFPHRYIYWILIALSIILGIGYSIPPVRFKSKPIVDLSSNALGYGCIAFTVGWLTHSSFSLHALINSLPYIFCVCAAFVNTTLPDLKGDHNSGDRTIGVLLGVKKSCIFSTLFLIIAAVMSLITMDYMALSVSLLCLPLFIYMTVTRRLSAIILATKSGILLLSLCVCIVIPYYLILLIAVLFAVKWYYLKRFGMKYPF